MPLEIEAKMKVDDLALVRERLRQAGATPAGRVREVNTFFDTPARALVDAGKGLRLRHNHGLDDGRDAFVITYKGPRRLGALKTREERELTVSDGADATALLEALGFEPILSFEKRRESWHLGGCRVELDEVPHLGPYVEIEGPDEATVLHVREQLGLAELPLVSTSYASMLTRHLRERGSTARIISFESRG